MVQLGTGDLWDSKGSFKWEDLWAFKELIQMELEDLWGSERVQLGIEDLGV